MLPNSTVNVTTIEELTYETYGLNIEAEKMGKKIDNIEAVKQAVYKILNTERYKHVIYSWNYGIELADLFGKSRDYVYSELPRRIKEALTQDDRISSVENFVFSSKRNVISVSFQVNSKYGNFESEVNVNV